MVEQAATQVPAIVTLAAQPTPSPPPTSPPEQPATEGSVCSLLRPPTDISLPVPFGGWVSGPLPRGLISELDRWFEPFLQSAVDDKVTRCSWFTYQRLEHGDEVVGIWYEYGAQRNPVDVGNALNSAFRNRGYLVPDIVTFPSIIVFLNVRVPELGNDVFVYVYVDPRSSVFIAHRQRSA